VLVCMRAMTKASWWLGTACIESGEECYSFIGSPVAPNQKHSHPLTIDVTYSKRSDSMASWRCYSHERTRADRLRFSLPNERVPTSGTKGRVKYTRCLLYYV
jgi:hypothetical protein